MMPKPKFDVRPTIARMDGTSTAALRDMHPDLTFVWDELDELRTVHDELADTQENLAALEETVKRACDDLMELAAGKRGPHSDKLREIIEDLKP